MPTVEAAQAASVLALPAPRYYAAAFAALERTEARSRMRQSAAATWIGSGATLRRFISPLRCLPERQRRVAVARASSYVATLPPRYMRTDNHAEAAAYASVAPLGDVTYTPAQLLAALLAEARRKLPAAKALPQAVAGPHPACLCRHCLTPVSAERRRQTATRVAEARRQRLACQRLTWPAPCLPGCRQRRLASARYRAAPYGAAHRWGAGTNDRYLDRQPS